MVLLEGVIVICSCQSVTTQSHLGWLDKFGLWTHPWGIVCITNWCRGAQPTVTRTAPTWVGLDCIRNMFEHASKHCFFLVSAWLSLVVDYNCKPNKPLFTLGCFWWWCFVITREEQTRTGSYKNISRGSLVRGSEQLKEYLGGIASTYHLSTYLSFCLSVYLWLYVLFDLQFCLNLLGINPKQWFLTCGLNPW